MPDRRGMGLIFCLAVAVRVAAILVLGSHLVPHSTYEHGPIAANLLAGRGFAVEFLGAEGPTSQQAPVYPLLVAAAYGMGGVATPAALLLLQLGQAVLGGVLAVLVMQLARALCGSERVWLPRVAGLIAALHPTLVYAATHVQVALLAATLVTLTLTLAEWAGRTGRWSHAAGVGLSLAILVLTDPILGLVAPAAFWMIARGHRPRRPRAVGLIGVAALTTCLAVSPWVARNHRVHGELVLVKSTFGYAFWQGNCPQSEGTDKVVRPSVEQALADRGTSLRDANRALWSARHEAGYIDDIALTAADYASLARLSEPRRSRVLFHRAWAAIRANPTRYVHLCLKRLRYFVFFDETNPKTRNAIYRVSHLGLTALAGLGLLVVGRPQRRWLAPTILTVALITLFHTLTIVSARFHIPIEPLLVVWAAAGLDALGRAIGSRWRQRTATAQTHAGPHRPLDAPQPRWLTTS